MCAPVQWVSVWWVLNVCASVWAYVSIQISHNCFWKIRIDADDSVEYDDVICYLWSKCTKYTGN